MWVTEESTEASTEYMCSERNNSFDYSRDGMQSAVANMQMPKGADEAKGGTAASKGQLVCAVPFGRKAPVCPMTSTANCLVSRAS
jgi:hypothetical protein